MFRTLLLAFVLLFTTATHAQEDGVVHVKSAYSLPETVSRIKADIAAKGITFFGEFDQMALAEKAGIHLRGSTLLMFGNPALGTLFIQAKPEAALDWPVRVVVQQDEQGDIYAIYTDFAWIARRHGVSGDAAKPFAMASEVIASITSAVRVK